MPNHSCIIVLHGHGDDFRKTNYIHHPYLLVFICSKDDGVSYISYNFLMGDMRQVPVHASLVKICNFPTTELLDLAALNKIMYIEYRLKSPKNEDMRYITDIGATGEFFIADYKPPDCIEGTELRLMIKKDPLIADWENQNDFLSEDNVIILSPQIVGFPPEPSSFLLSEMLNLAIPNIAFVGERVNGGWDLKKVSNFHVGWGDQCRVCSLLSLQDEAPNIIWSACRYAQAMEVEEPVASSSGEGSSSDFSGEAPDFGISSLTI